MSELAENLDNNTNVNQYLTFVVNDEEYGVDILRVMEIRNWEKPTTIPESPNCIRGVINLRGLMVPILDLRERLGMDYREYNKFTVVVVVQLDESDKSDVLGLVVDAVSDVYSITAEQHKGVPETALKGQQDYITGLAMQDNKSIILLDCGKLIDDRVALNSIKSTKPKESVDTEVSSNTLFERLGGERAVECAVDNFYEKVLADNRINHFFKNTDMTKQKRMQKAFLTMAFGGPNNYNGVGLRKAHASAVSNGLNDTHFDVVVELLASTLTELGVSKTDIEEVASIAETVRIDVLNK